MAAGTECVNVCGLLQKNSRSGAGLGSLNFITRSHPSSARVQQLFTPTAAIMSMFRARRLDLGGYVNIRNIRDHTKRKVYMEHEPERYASLCI